MTSPALVVLLLAFAGIASAQTPSIRGRVVSDTGLPLRNALVSQIKTAVRTDADGRFAIDAQSGFPLVVTKGGFVRQSFPVVPGELLVTMARGGALTVFVIDASGKPVDRARVTLTCNRISAGGSPTDDRGQRRFSGLAPGRCDVSTGESEPPPALRPPQSPEQLAAQSQEMRARSERERADHLARATGVDIRAGEETSIVLIGTATATAMPVARGNSVISGTILDEFGEPAEDVVVQLQPANGDSGVPPQLPALLAASVMPGAGISIAGVAATTDDRGQFRIAGVPAGAYRVVTGGSRAMPTRLVYYPGRRESSEASIVTVDADAEIANIDFALTSGSQGVVVGHVLMSSGQPPAGASAQLVSSGTSDGPPRAVAAAKANAQGQFIFEGVAPGTYDLQVEAASSYVVVTQRREEVMATPPRPPMEFGRGTVTVSDATPVTVSIRTAPGVSLRGRVEFEGDRGTLALSDLRVVPVGDPSRAAAVAADGTFELRNLYGETRMAVAGGTAGWWLKSFMVGGVNAAEDPVAFMNATDARADARVVLARAAVVSGAVTRAGASGRVVAFPVDADRRYSGSRYVRTTTIGRDGRYTLDVPPGQYWVVAVESGPPLTEALMVRLQSLSTQVTASDTRAAQVDLSMARLPQ